MEIGSRDAPYDLIVIGGGPAGCAAAVKARQLGRSVLLLERAAFPRHKVCGEFVSQESLRVLEQLLVPQDRGLVSSAPRIAAARLFLDRAKIRVEILPSALSITRFELDEALWRSSMRMGADVRQATTVRAVELQHPGSEHESRFRVVTATESFSAKAVINASGRWSSLTSGAKRASLTGEHWIGLKGHFRETSRPASVDLYFFKGGYCGVQPVGTKHQDGGELVNVCAMVKSGVARSLSQVVVRDRRLAERSAKWQPVSEQVSTSPLLFHPPEPVEGSMLQVGDAAAFVDPFIGDGISLALRSGTLAGECLRKFFGGESSLAEAAADYSWRYDNCFSPVLRASSWLRRMLAWPAAVRRPALLLLESAPLVARQLVRITR
ncbi:MAG: FAD-dependent monooxygenase [Acidobacteria bacterium]|nr:FAD-dependent monooxygenase [Acidobacteriota bacterium]